MNLLAEEGVLLSALSALGPYLEHIVVIGGWAHRLHAYHAMVRPQSFAPMATADIDLALPARVPRASQAIPALMKSAGLTEQVAMDGKPPVTRYVAGQSVVVEFITPRRGGALRRNGTPSTVREIAGVGAVCLLDIELLLHEPWQVPLARQLLVRVANPTSFIVHKLLTMEARHNLAKRPKDLLYVHDTLLAFGGAFEELRRQWKRLFPLVRRGARTTLRRQLARLEKVNDLARGAAEIARQQRIDAPTAEQIRAVCRRALHDIIGDDL